ncbi:MAG: hypothetical protein IPK50_11435 [Fibrobacterota bacterium]|nr:hypothetical protein [Fibrobacterota bacterium]QQS07486.1 MAG: hypothetical protein IPK50_11435 [Fibrobacterota bacterium]
MKTFSALAILWGSSLAFGAGSDGETWSVDASLRLGGVRSDAIDEDESFYARIPLVIRDEKGKAERLEVSTTPTGFDITVLGAIDRPWRLGVGLGYGRSESYASNGSTSASAAPFLEQYQASLRGRWLPMIESMKAGGSIRMEVDAGIGGTMGTLHRFGLAREQVDTRPDSISRENLRTFRDGNRPVDILGLGAECTVNAARQWESGVRFGAGVGLTYQIFWLDRDPLAGVELGGATYPEGPQEFGILFRLFVGYAI